MPISFLKLTFKVILLFLIGVNENCNASEEYDVEYEYKDGSVLQQKIDEAIRAKTYDKDLLRISIPQGVYLLREPIVIDGEGELFVQNEIKELVVEGLGDVVFLGAKRYIAKGSSFRSTVKLKPNLKLNNYSLYVNGQRMVRARYPSINTFLPLVNDQSNNYDQIDLNDETNRFLKTKVSNIENIKVNIDHAWDSSIHNLLSFNSNSLYVEPATKYPLNRWQGRQNYFLDGSLAFLDEPMEWSHSANCRCIEYFPNYSQNNSHLTYSIPLAEKAVLISNIGSNSHDGLKKLTLRNLKFTTYGVNNSSVKFKGGQAATKVKSSVINVTNSNNVILEKLEVSNTDAHAIRLVNSFKVKVFDSTLKHIGGGGIYVYGGTEHQTKVIILNNTIQDIGEVYEGAVAVWLGDVGDNCIVNNIINNTGYSGISVGWTWGYKKNESNRNIIAYNQITNVGRGRLSDLGAIYLLGVSPFTVVDSNFIQNVSDYGNLGRGAWGIYLDEGSSNITVSNNIVLDAKSASFHLHYGQNNYVINNLFASSYAGELVRISRPKDQKITFKDNILVGNGALFNSWWFKNKIHASGNKLFVNSQLNEILTAKKKEPIPQGYVIVDEINFTIGNQQINQDLLEHFMKRENTAYIYQPNVVINDVLSSNCD